MYLFLSNLRFLFYPSYWLMNENYCSYWDASISKRLDANLPVSKEGALIRLGTLKLWGLNYPYAYATPYRGKHFRPSRLTILRLHKKVEELECLT